MSRSQRPHPNPQGWPDAGQQPQDQDAGRPPIGFLQGRTGNGPAFDPPMPADPYSQSQQQGYRGAPAGQLPADGNYLGNAPLPQSPAPYAPPMQRNYPPAYESYAPAPTQQQQAPPAWDGGAQRAAPTASAQPAFGYPAAQPARGYPGEQGLSQLAARPVQAAYPQHQQPAPDPYASPGAPQFSANPAWPGQPNAPDSRGFDFGSYLNPAPQSAPQQPSYGEDQYHWGNDSYEPHDASHARFGAEAHFTDAYDQGTAGQFEEFGSEEEFESPAPRRGGMKVFAMAAIGCAVLVGGGLAYAYRAYVAVDPSGEPPVIKSDAGPARTKPTDPGGKQFAYTDSKVMGRLSDGGASSSSEPAEDAGAASEPASSESDSSGARRVQTIAVGRDGSIVAPPSSPTPPVAVPGLMVDGFGRGPQQAPPTVRAITVQPPSATASLPEQTRQVDSTPAKPVVIAKASPPTEEATYSPAAGPSEEPPAVETRKPAASPKRIAVAAPAATAPVTSSSGGSGFVAVIASVPASSSSRMDALKQFADMQQKYGSALQNKTPDVQEANLAGKGLYHRLLVGPPGSREQASSVCSDLKSAGYSSCWVTSY